MTEGLFLGLLTAFAAGWGSLWWRMGKMEAKVNGSLREWGELKRACPLCPKRNGENQ